MGRTLFVIAFSVIGLVAAVALWVDKPDETRNLYATWEKACPQHRAAIRDAFSGLGLDDEPPEEHPAYEIMDRWRYGDLEMLECEILRRRATHALNHRIRVSQGASASEMAGARAYEREELFSLHYFIWRKKGEDEDILVALAQAMEPADVRGALSMHRFRDPVRPRALRDEDGDILPEDPGYRFIEMAREARAGTDDASN